MFVHICHDSSHTPLLAEVIMQVSHAGRVCVACCLPSTVRQTGLSYYWL